MLFSELEKKSRYKLHQVADQAIKKSAKNKGIVIDNDSPIGANDTMRLFAALSNGEVIYMDYGI